MGSQTLTFSEQRPLGLTDLVQVKAYSLPRTIIRTHHLPDEVGYSDRISKLEEDMDILTSMFLYHKPICGSTSYTQTSASLLRSCPFVFFLSPLTEGLQVLMSRRMLVDFHLK